MPENLEIKRAMSRGMRTLMSEKKFDDITVAEICEVSAVSRRTFYRYFQDKYELLNFVHYDDLCRFFDDKSTAVETAEGGGEALHDEHGVFGLCPLRGDREKLTQAFRHEAGVLADLQPDLQHACKALFFALPLHQTEQAAGDRQLVHQRSRQLKQGSMLAMMRPASATVLPRSMWGTVGVFL